MNSIAYIIISCKIGKVSVWRHHFFIQNEINKKYRCDSTEIGMIDRGIIRESI